jgi:predicted short-subunit dehydrogenase-like oxidoreductase (DUF2520 family)
VTTFRVIGTGRAGAAIQQALTMRDWSAQEPLRHHEDSTGAAEGVDYLILAVPDAAIESVAAQIRISSHTAVIHLAGSLGPDVLGPHPRRAAVHPLVSLTPDHGAQRLLSGAWFGLTASPGTEAAARELVAALGGRPIDVPSGRRALYHAAASVASNHVVALLAQVERLALASGVPTEALLELAAGSLDNVRMAGPAAALTGPVARGDWPTVARHRRALPDYERALYEALANAAARLAGRDLPPPGP